mmetsp:Transcript_10432/g.26238  ORF Transcript_10432/g.26238 Transcript_10432/m.26238 type:complete len:793 (-) Transcript_10432:176-2554(-)
MDVPTWICIPLPNQTKSVLDATSLVPIYAGDRRMVGRMELRIPDKKISRRMFEYNCAQDGTLTILVQGLNIVYFSSSFEGAREPMRKNTPQPITDENCIFLLPGSIHAVLFRRYSFWLTEDPEASTILLEKYPFLRRTMTGSDFQPPGSGAQRQQVPDLVLASDENPSTHSENANGESSDAASLITQVEKPSRQYQGLVSPPKERKERSTQSRKVEGLISPRRGSRTEQPTLHRIKVYLEDSLVLRQLGLNNTFRTLILFPQTDTRELHEQMIRKLCKAMTRLQREAVFKETEDYRLYEIMPDGSHRMVEFNETPYQKVKEMYFKLPSYAARARSPVPSRKSTPAVKPSETLASTAGTAASTSSQRIRGLSSDDLSREVSAVISEQPAVAKATGKTVVKAFLRDNIVFRQLGLHNTYKTLMLDADTSVEQMNAMMVQKMCKAMTPAQVDQLTHECKCYSMFEVTAEGDRFIGRDEFPASLMPTRFCFLPEGSPSISGPSITSGSAHAEDAEQVKVLLAESIMLKQLNLSGTFKTVELTPFQTATAIKMELIKKMCKGLTSSQVQLVQKECAGYWLYEGPSKEDSRALEPEERPYRKLKNELWFRPRVLLQKRRSTKSMSQFVNARPAQPGIADTGSDGGSPPDMLRLSLKPSKIEELIALAASDASASAEQGAAALSPMTKDSSSPRARPASDELSPMSSPSTPRKARTIIQIADGWRLKVPFPSNARVSELTEEVRQRISKRLPRLQSAAGKSEKDVQSIVLATEDGAELDPNDILEDVWSDRDVIHIVWV